MKEKTTTPKIIILLKIKIKKRIKKASSTTKDVYYYIPADQQQKSLFFLLNKIPIHFFCKQKKNSKINFIILPSFEKKNQHEIFCHSKINNASFLEFCFFKLYDFYLKF